MIHAHAIFDSSPAEHAFHVGSGSGLFWPWAPMQTLERAAPPTGGDYYAMRLRDAGRFAGTGSVVRLTVSSRPTDFSGVSWLEEPFFPSTAATPASSIGQVLDEICAHLGITMSQLAAALRLTRPTLYRWYEGRQPHAGNKARLAALEEFARGWQRAGLPAARQHWARGIPALGQTLGEFLTGETLAAPTLFGALPHITQAVQGRPAIEPLPPRKRSGTRPEASALSEHSPPLEFDEK